MTVKLVGNDEIPVHNTWGGNAFVLTKFAAERTGTCTEVRIKLKAGAYVKVAVYADSSGEPGARLAKQDTSTPCGSGWNTIALEASCSIVSGTNYWLAFISDWDQVGFQYFERVGRNRTENFYYFNFPDPAGSGFSSTTIFDTGIAGWGGVVISLTGSSAGVCSLSGLAGIIFALAGIIQGVASVSGLAGILQWLAGVSSGIASVSGLALITRGLAGLASGVCSVIGSSVTTWGLAGVASGICSVTASLGRWTLLAGLIAGVATVTGRLFHVRYSIRELSAVRNLPAARNIPPVR